MSRKASYPIVLWLGMAAAASSSGEEPHRYLAYRNPPKPRLVVLPVQSRKLERTAKAAFSETLAMEAGKLSGFKIVPIPDAIARDSLGQIPPQSLPALQQRFAIDLLLQSKLEFAAGKNVFFAEIIDTRDGDIRASYHGECQCPVSDLLAWMVPEAIRKLGMAMTLRKFKCGPGMALIPASILPGSHDPDSTGAQWGQGTFCMDRYEYPNQFGGEPFTAATWKEASELCSQDGKRLCSEAEWQLACEGGKGLAFPYGSDYDEGACNTRSRTIQLAGRRPLCKSHHGIFDLSGNLYEWTSTDWSARFKDKVVKGGNWNSGPENSGCHERFGQPAGEASRAIGFRCCSSVRP